MSEYLKIVEELDLFVEKQNISKYVTLNDYYLNLRSKIMYLLTDTVNNAIETSLYCLRLESELQLFIFYLELLECDDIELNEIEIVKLIKKDMEPYLNEMINTKHIGDISILMKHNYQSDNQRKTNVCFRD